MYHASVHALPLRFGACSPLFWLLQSAFERPACKLFLPAWTIAFKETNFRRVIHKSGPLPPQVLRSLHEEHTIELKRLTSQQELQQPQRNASKPPSRRSSGAAGDEGQQGGGSQYLRQSINWKPSESSARRPQPPPSALESIYREKGMVMKPKVGEAANHCGVLEI